MKKTPVTIKEMDVQPISDEELQSFSNVAGGTSDVWVCSDCSSSWWICYASAR